LGLNVDRLTDPGRIGRVRAEGFVPLPGGKYRHKNPMLMVIRMAARILDRNLSGAWRESPFFDEAGAPARPPHILDRDERMAALKALATGRVPARR
jgi:hypothetical protein